MISVLSIIVIIFVVIVIISTIIKRRKILINTASGLLRTVLTLLLTKEHILQFSSTPDDFIRFRNSTSCFEGFVVVGVILMMTISVEVIEVIVMMIMITKILL